MKSILYIAAKLDLPEAHLVVAFKNKGYHVQVIIEPDGVHNKLLEDAGIPIHYLTFKSRFSIPTILKLRKLVKEIKPDILHLFSARAVSNALPATYGMPLKRVAYRGTMGRLAVWDPLSWASFLNPGIHRIICVSNAVRNFMLSIGVSKDKAVAIYKGHRLEWYDSIPSVSRSEFNIPENAFVVTCVANMRPVKGIDVLIDSAKFLPVDTNIKFLLIGDVRDNSIYDAVKKNGRDDLFIFTGFRKNPAGIVRNADCFILPSVEREGLAKALIEAMSQGVPAIGTDVGGIPEVIEDGVSGIIIPPKNAKAIAEAIIRMQGSDYKEMGARARERIRDWFVIDRTVEGTERVYEEI